MLNRVSSQMVPRQIQDRLNVFFEDLKSVGISYIGHGVVSDLGNHTGYFSDDNWGEFYIQNKYFFKEPILEKYQQNDTGLISWHALEDANSIAHTRNEFTNLVAGMTIYKKENEFITFFNIGFDKEVDLIEFSFFNRDLLLAYFNIFNNYHLSWRKGKGY